MMAFCRLYEQLPETHRLPFQLTTQHQNIVEKQRRQESHSGAVHFMKEGLNHNDMPH